MGGFPRKPIWGVFDAPNWVPEDGLRPKRTHDVLAPGRWEAVPEYEVMRREWEAVGKEKKRKWYKRVLRVLCFC